MGFWLTLLSSGAFSTTLAAILVYLSKSVIGVRIEQSIRHEYGVKLAEFKANAEHRNQLAIERLRSDFFATQSTAFKALSEGQRLSHSRTLDAIEVLWSEIVSLRNNTPSVIVFMNVLQRDEYSTLVQREDQRRLVEESVRCAFVEDVDEDAVQNARLFAGDKLYEVFFAYRQILGRILFQLQKGLEQGELEAWYEERGMKGILGVTFSEDETLLITRDGFNELRITLAILERRFLTIASAIQTGRDAALGTVESAGEILKVVGELEKDKAHSDTGGKPSDDTKAAQ